MSNAVFPALVGLDWSRRRIPIWKTVTHDSVSGRETRLGLWSYPKWRWELSYEFLRSDAVNAEWQSLLGFFLARRGAWDTFLFEDWEDKTATAQQIGVGNGTATQYQLVRTLGGYTEPTKEIKGTPKIYLAGVEQQSGWSVNSTGLVTFTSPPGNGIVVTATFDFYWRVRFLEDELELEGFSYKFWSAKKVELISVK
jgi:uncharacterized protein (TIGR02217 family)